MGRRTGWNFGNHSPSVIDMLRGDSPITDNNPPTVYTVTVTVTVTVARIERIDHKNYTHRTHLGCAVD
jgi:hypothetical protein